MKTSYIYGMAMNELLRKVGTEQSRLKENPDSEISKAKLERYDTEYNELRQMSIKSEKAEAM